LYGSLLMTRTAFHARYAAVVPSVACTTKLCR